MEKISNQVMTVHDANYLSPAAGVPDALVRYQAMKDFIGKVLRKGVDFGAIPGTSKDTLLKPGAEKLASFFGLAASYELVEAVKDWTGKDSKGEAFFYFHYRCKLYRGDRLAGEGEGSCNSWETKYRYRKSERVCPGCGAEAIIKGKAEYGGGWICFAKKGGCGARYKDGDPEIESQQAGRVPNPDVADSVNTIQKMAQKRALVAAVLVTTNASDWFTQDMEDFVDGGCELVTVQVSTYASQGVNVPELEFIEAEFVPEATGLTIEEAYAVKNSEGVPYGELSADKLSKMTIGINNGLKNNGLTAEERAEYVRKLEAIKVLLRAKADGSIG